MPSPCSPSTCSRSTNPGDSVGSVATGGERQLDNGNATVGSSASSLLDCLHRKTNYRVYKAKKNHRTDIAPHQWDRLNYYSNDQFLRDSRKHLETGGNIQVVRAKDLSVNDFIERFEKTNTPVIIRGCIDHWPAMQKWNVETLSRLHKKGLFKVGEDDDGHRIKMRLKYFLDYMRVQKDDSPLYLFESSVEDAANTCDLIQDWEAPEYFPFDLHAVVGDDKRPPCRWFCIGPERSGTTIHIDPLGTSAWNALVRGTKRWVLMSPDVPRRAAKGLDVKLRGEDDEAIVWFHRVLPRIKSTYFASDEKQLYEQPTNLSDDGIPVEKIMKTRENDSQHQGYRIIECLQKAGDVIFVPPGWWHAVVNIEDTIGCTQNYVSYANFDRAWCSMRRGRPRLATLWYRRLKVFYTDLHHRAGFLNARDGWGIASGKFKKKTVEIAGDGVGCKGKDSSVATQCHEDGSSSSDNSSSSSSSSSDDEDEMQEIASKISSRKSTVELQNLNTIQYFGCATPHDGEMPGVDYRHMNRQPGGGGEDGVHPSTMANWRKTTIGELSQKEANAASNVASLPEYKRRCTDTSSGNNLLHYFTDNATERNMCHIASVPPFDSTVCDSSWSR
eukprot:GHVS01058283.1.p1 GENE.GHVS01058283.1~~GHVS01058283.1.p1  ORF type:complete len:613 (-),score=70.52 GHVS01058283.1:169-2007(-)